MPFYSKKGGSKKKLTCNGGGFYFDVNAEHVGGLPPVNGYNDFAPPIFVGELLDGRNENLQSLTGSGAQLNGGGKQKLQHKIDTLKLYIQKNGQYPLSKEIVADLHKLKKSKN